MSEREEVWITGVGIASSLGVDTDATWAALLRREIKYDRHVYSPWIVHSMASFNLDAQIPKRGDQRQMGMWQRIGTYAAGIALDSAGIKGDRELLARTDMIVAAGGGERDLEVDSAVLSALVRKDARLETLNQLLMDGLRPTLFLAQLSNLLAGNISIVHGVSGSSRTFMGEEGAGMEAVRSAWARIVHGQSEIALVGAAHNALRPELLMLYECGGHNLKGEFAPVWARAGGGFALGSGAAFLVLESRRHAEARSAAPYATLSNVVATLSDRSRPGSIAATLREMWQSLEAAGAPTAVLSGATGTAISTDEERAFLQNLPNIAVRGFATSFGHLMEAQFPLGIALAALSLFRGELYPPPLESDFESQVLIVPASIRVTGVGHRRAEAAALVEAAGAPRKAPPEVAR
jgi:3-oxoacyl-[acyl-carrier-protein] synthase II